MFSSGFTDSVVEVNDWEKLEGWSNNHGSCGKCNRISPSGPDWIKVNSLPVLLQGVVTAFKEDENIIIILRPVNCPIVNEVPIGIAKKAGIKVADKEIRNVKKTILHKVASPDEIKLNVAFKIFKKVSFSRLGSCSGR
jgi:hypothetical protein